MVIKNKHINKNSKNYKKIEDVASEIEEDMKKISTLILNNHVRINILNMKDGLKINIIKNLINMHVKIMINILKDIKKNWRNILT